MGFMQDYSQELTQMITLISITADEFYLSYNFYRTFATDKSRSFFF